MFRFQSINYIGLKIKAFDRKGVYVAIIIVALASIGYYTALIMGIRAREIPVTIQQPPVLPTASTTSVEKAYVASKKGTKYHLPTCIGAKSIKEGNRIWFGSKSEAERAGYSPAGNCKGI
jgi:hypothetical protein